MFSICQAMDASTRQGAERFFAMEWIGRSVHWECGIGDARSQGFAYG